MANVIIGHTTDRSARIWLRGNRRAPLARVFLERDGHEIDRRDVKLRRSRDYTGLVDFTNLEPQTTYTIRSEFAKRRRWFRGASIERAPLGRLRTAPSAVPGKSAALTFVFGSCNLNNVKVNNVLGLVAGVVGSYVFGRALRRDCNPPDRDVFVIAWAKAALKFVSKVTAALVYMLTKYRQPAPPWVASPFLRLATLFGSWQVTTVRGSARAGVGTVVIGERSAATAIVALAADAAADDASTTASGTMLEKPPESRDADEEQRLVLVATNDKRLLAGERLVWGEQRDGEYAAAASLNRVEERIAESPPQLMLHLGDQIYFDFPTRDPRPTLRNYRRAYREAWCEDDVAALFLAKCPQYMTLDDHEIFNNFATDSIAPRPRHGAAAYSDPALTAYDEYVHSRHPRPASTGAKCGECGKPSGSGRPLYYSFSHGAGAHFFVMDTRTERYNGGLIGEPARMISCCQLAALTRWLDQRHPNDFVFIVTSVPFVPEVHATADDVPLDGRAPRTSVDKWCAGAFAAQREAIVRHLCKRKLKRVVFLAGDMHCCYHAIMKIRMENEPTRMMTIHELGAGPIYQLRLARADNFYEVYRGEYGSGEDRLAFMSRVQHFYSLANAVMTVKAADDDIAGPHVLWDVIPTVGQHDAENLARDTVSGAVGAERRANRRRRQRRPEALRSRELPPLDPAEPVMRGKICFPS